MKSSILNSRRQQSKVFLLLSFFNNSFEFTTFFLFGDFFFFCQSLFSLSNKWRPISHGAAFAKKRGWKKISFPSRLWGKRNGNERDLMKKVEEEEDGDVVKAAAMSHACLNFHSGWGRTKNFDLFQSNNSHSVCFLLHNELC